VWCGNEGLFINKFECFDELRNYYFLKQQFAALNWWSDVESSAELRGPVNEWMSRMWVQALIIPHAVWLSNRPFVPLTLYFDSWVAGPFNKVSRTKVGMSKCGQNFTLTQNMNWYFYRCSSLPIQRSFYLPHYVECLLRVLQPVEKPIITLDCLMFKDNYLALAARLVQDISCWDCLS
jgi:hypothetical protein